MRVVDAIVEVTGIPRSDIRSIQVIWNMDAYRVRTWNRRTLVVDGLTVYNRRTR
jgi:hypothetical protein